MSFVWHNFCELAPLGIKTLCRWRVVQKKRVKIGRCDLSVNLFTSPQFFKHHHRAKSFLKSQADYIWLKKLLLGVDTRDKFQAALAKLS